MLVRKKRGESRLSRRFEGKSPLGEQSSSPLRTVDPLRKRAAARRRGEESSSFFPGKDDGRGGKRKEFPASPGGKRGKRRRVRQKKRGKKGRNMRLLFRPAGEEGAAAPEKKREVSPRRL